MKSIVHEASSIAKAIEQGLAKAGNPRDFAVKVLEYPEKNFFGMTTKPAKIALYVEERTRKTHEPHSMPGVERAERVRDTQERSERTRDQRDHAGAAREPREFNERGRDRHREASPRTERAERTERGERTERRERRPFRADDSRSADGNNHESATSAPEAYTSRRSEEPLTPRWNADAVRHTKDWLTRVLSEMHKLVPFTVDIEALQLRITLDRALFDDPERERRVLASLSLLLLETCKHVCRINLRGHKVVLSHR